jgi:two-component system sensor histidine kinase KdpD
VRRRDPARRIQAQVPAGLPLVRADAVLLGQLLDNLLDNALKYSDGPVQLRAAAGGGALRIEVLDRGPGIEADELPRLFETFFRGRRAAGVRGAGLGLAVCRAIAAAHGATLTAHGRRRGGSRFLLCLPVEAAPPAPADDAP